MFSRIGIGARLFVAFLGVAGLSLSSGIAGWIIFREVSQAQSLITQKALPAVAATQHIAEATARLVAAAPRWSSAADESTRAGLEADDPEACAALAADLPLRAEIGATTRIFLGEEDVI